MRTKRISKSTSSVTISFKEKLSGLVNIVVTKIKDRDFFFGNRREMRRLLNSRRKTVRFVILVLAMIFIGRYLFNLTNQQKRTGDILDNRKEVQGAKASQELNKEMSFPLKDASGEEVSRIKFVIEKAELRNEIVVKGQKATAISGRTFLILTLKVTNEHNQAVEIDTRDYVRLSINGNGEEWLAPDIHNDPVEVQAISTKYSRVGFPIDDGDTDMTIRIGEINGDKEDVSIELK